MKEIKNGEKESTLARVGAAVVGIFILIGLFSPFYYEHQLVEIKQFNFVQGVLAFLFVLLAILMGLGFVCVSIKGKLPEWVDKLLTK